MRSIHEVAAELDLGDDDLLSFGPHMAKLRLSTVTRLSAKPRGRIVLVSAINPTPAGEGKTTVSVGLAQGLRRRGHRAVAALREPSLGPIFGIKGGGTGGGKSRLEPSDRINLHCTGDLHAVTAAHNLLAALVDNAINFRAGLDLEHRQVLWRRVLDMNDRFLRRIVIGLGGRTGGVPREDAFDITAASEVMAILSLARDIPDLKARLARIVVGFDRGGEPVTAGRLEAAGAMAALLHDAILPNMVQTTEGGPAFVHGGPFGNIAHGCSSVIATRAALGAADLVVTEAGFGFDLGAEKFFDIKCRAAGVWPSAVVLVVTARALRSHGRGDLAIGLDHLDHHVASVAAFGFKPVIAINVFPDDDPADLKAIAAAAAERGLGAAEVRCFTEGGAGAERLADLVAETAKASTATPKFLYELDDPPLKKLENVARTIYGARAVELSRAAKDELARAVADGHGNLPVCVAKTHLSLSDDPRAVGRPRDHVLGVRGVRVSVGAGYILALAGEIVTMPGLPRQPASANIDLTDDGEIVGVH
ncbi:MAG: formate--tetrahydrofolate ligase [Myxococcales bacterium]|nr:formate--tetrahydrofolate ligase [Myxococcales bacterium]